MKDPGSSDCALLTARIAEILDGDLREQPLPALRAHAVDCGPCATLLEVHQALALDLGRGTPVPKLEVPVPALPAGRVIGIGRRAVAAVAAAVLVAFSVQAWNSSPVAEAPLGVPVRVVSIETAPAGPWSADEDLVSLTAGWEAVASLRPARPQ